jgi:hypothetical protein
MLVEVACSDWEVLADLPAAARRGAAAIKPRAMCTTAEYPSGVRSFAPQQQSRYDGNVSSTTSMVDSARAFNGAGFFLLHLGARGSNVAPMYTRCACRVVRVNSDGAISAAPNLGRLVCNCGAGARGIVPCFCYKARPFHLCSPTVDPLALLGSGDRWQRSSCVRARTGLTRPESRDVTFNQSGWAERFVRWFGNLPLTVVGGYSLLAGMLFSAMESSGWIDWGNEEILLAIVPIAAWAVARTWIDRR